MTEVQYEGHMTHVLHIARISNVDSVMFVNRIRDMVSKLTISVILFTSHSYLILNQLIFSFFFFLFFLLDTKEPKFAVTLYLVDSMAKLFPHFAKPIMQQNIVRSFAIFAIVG